MFFLYQIAIWSFTMPFVMIVLPFLFHRLSLEKTTPHTQRAIVSVFKNLCISIPFLVAYTDHVIFHREWVDFDTEIEYKRFFVEILFILVLTDTWFYFWHRLLHTPFFYKFHKVHHSYNPTITLSYTAMTPIEFIFENTIYFMAPPLIGSPWSGFGKIHFFSWACANIYVLVWGAMIHNNTIVGAFFPSVLNRPTDHQLHHRHGQKNRRFSLLFTFWDRLLGTYD